ncbi:MAG: PorT family protein [Bacteroidetes bacterium]|nr:PorT family protein [Bacteroidota bacterium]MBS1607314.1 PorT family protein [Bacteroidota bacterium]
MISLPARPISFSLALLFFSNMVTIAQTRLNFFAGPQVTTVNYVVHDENQNTEIKPGFQAGAGAKIEFENRLFFSPSVYYSLKGYKVTLNKSALPPDPSATNNNVNVHTIETAFLLQYDFNKQPSHFFIKLGPSLDFQISGHEKFNRVDGTTVSRSMKFDFSGYGRYAASAVLHAGYEMKSSIFFFVYYQQGLTNLDNADTGPTIKYRVAGVSVGKFF